ncbi:hypothetical protein GCM10009754_12200 [Amycolatopsis minnesotensis]|uniref:Uncharacterized protein n=1 Tax=Amycolatopsis minnesotensis TaxID=337894 RepID=A0ABN2Q9I8_9PSEU
MLVVSLAACGRAAEPAAATWTTSAAQVTGARPGPAPNTAVLEVVLPAGGEDCAKDLRVEMLTEENGTVHANVVFSSRSSSAVGACPAKVRAETTLSTPGPLGDRPLMLNSMDVWHRLGATYGRCDEHLGCAPPADHCAEAWIDKTTFDADVPVKHLNGARDVRACDGTWLVLDLNRHVGGCPPADGVPACSATGTANRVVYRWNGTHWGSVAGVKGAGCDEIKTRLPEFPSVLCDRLPSP